VAGTPPLELMPCSLFFFFLALFFGQCLIYFVQASLDCDLPIYNLLHSWKDGWDDSYTLPHPLFLLVEMGVSLAFLFLRWSQTSILDVYLPSS
jgi:hypothetical protein